ncbi:hypothetical protein AA19596_0309 [Acetobacter fabarum DSM 19596]|nr:hypothetical protein AA19596_0309 [Acetobacter fabarum DSM 19596]
MQRNHAVLGLRQMYLSGLPWRGEIKRANRAQHLTAGPEWGGHLPTWFSTSDKVHRGLNT